MDAFVNLSLEGKVALVTGGSRGIGAAIVRLLAQRGASVAFCYRQNAELAQQLAQQVQQGTGKKVLAFRADVTDAEQAMTMVQKVQEGLGEVDILVNNAGITRDALLLRMDEEKWDEVLDTNLRGAFLCTRAVLPMMLAKRWGRIINITSIVGLIGNAGQTNYAAAKAGLIGFTKSLAKELGGRNITVNAVAPGFIVTDMTAALTEERRNFLPEPNSFASVRSTRRSRRSRRLFGFRGSPLHHGSGHRRGRGVGMRLFTTANSSAIICTPLLQTLPFSAKG